MKRGRTSPFVEAADETKRYVEQLAEKEKQPQDSQAAEAAARRFRERQVELLDAREALRICVRATREANERQRRLDGAKQLAEQARATVERIQADRLRVEAKIAEAARLRDAVAAQEVEANRLTGRETFGGCRGNAASR
jgi:hypothetical protein